MMTAKDFLTQEMLDKLQYEADDNNGIIDEDLIAPLMEQYATEVVNKNALLHSVSHRTFKYKCNRCGTLYNIGSTITTIPCCTAPCEHRSSNICGGFLEAYGG